MNEDLTLLTDFTEQDFTAPYQKELYQYWLFLKGDRQMPARSDLDITLMKGYLPSLMLLDYEDNDQSFTFRLIGTDCVNLYGEQTGKKMNDLPLHVAAVDRLMWTINNKKPYFAKKNLDNIDKKYVRTSFIVLPLSENGIDVDKVLVSHHFS